MITPLVMLALMTGPWIVLRSRAAGAIVSFSLS